jgi:hypothetical protein
MLVVMIPLALYGSLKHPVILPAVVAGQDKVTIAQLPIRNGLVEGGRFPVPYQLALHLVITMTLIGK